MIKLINVPATVDKNGQKVVYSNFYIVDTACNEWVPVEPKFVSKEKPWNYRSMCKFAQNVSEDNWKCYRETKDLIYLG